MIKTACSAFVALVAAAGVLVAVPALAQAPTVRLVQTGNPLSGLYTDRCAKDLAAVLQKRGYKTESRVWGDPALAKRPSDMVEIGIVTPLDALTTMTIEPDGWQEINRYSPFPTPQAFARFLKSPLYDELFHENLARQLLLPGKLAGVAYGSTAQIITRDKQITSPVDLYQRTMIGDVDSVWYVDVHDDLAIAYDAVLGHTDSSFAYQQQAIAGAMKQYGAADSFLVLPVAQLIFVVSPDFRQFVSLAMTHMELVDFVVSGWDEITDESLQDAIYAAVKETAVTCSAENFENDKEAIDFIKGRGTTVTPVDLRPFQQLSSGVIQKRLAESRAAYEKFGPKKSDTPDSAVESQAEYDAHIKFDSAHSAAELFARLRDIR